MCYEVGIQCNRFLNVLHGVFCSCKAQNIKAINTFYIIHLLISPVSQLLSPVLYTITTTSGGSEI